MATGQFRYTYTNAEGYDAVGFLNDPPSGQCTNLPAPAAAEGAAATATVFLHADRAGDTYLTLPAGADASDRLLLRSVVFSKQPPPRDTSPAGPGATVHQDRRGFRWWDC
ncbi:hypothetical protein ACFV2Z_36000 [Streptomyces sp. NPDC059688]|uniref:hypothetical protein n=1 Tax=Streptomyces sp. NPDC059688 TaxID=3346906 RepID=UPI0036C33F56